MPTLKMQGRTFDARPDRIDLRDREYLPPLVSLPEQSPDAAFIKKHLNRYSEHLILNQGRQGACTGFGLAAVINYLLWRKSLDALARARQRVPCVSPRMLYQMARVYDEWPGEDYEGSSCRGAMKGWQRHGVCAQAMWPYADKKGGFVPPKKGWQQDAAQRTLGAYYRINKDSVVDMQAAIHEVGAIYVSAAVHEGWSLGRTQEIRAIPRKPTQGAGHAFALVGYTADGFIVQNSWGAAWGFKGFAILTYPDWVENGTDAWVAVLGAPVALPKELEGARSLSSVRLRDVVDSRASWFWQPESVGSRPRYANPKVEPYAESRAYEHTVVLGNNGRPINRLLDRANAEDAVAEVCRLPIEWLKKQAAPKLALYAHGGLNDEATSLKRIRVMAPYFVENAIYPIFVTWKTGFLDSFDGIIRDALERFLSNRGPAPSQGWWDGLKQRLGDAKDRTVEAACEDVLVKAVWTQIKQNAQAAAGPRAGLDLIAGHLARLRDSVPGLEIHLVGHSAGSLLLGHLLDRCADGDKKVSVSTCSLYAAACTVRFALDHVKPAIDNKVLLSGPDNRGALFCDMMSDSRELADTVGPYGKSLLYLVSRALEDVHKMPLLGMEGAWSPDLNGEKPDLWNEDKRGDVNAWIEYAKAHIPKPKVHTGTLVDDGREKIPLAHGSFDNDVSVVAATLERIRGSALAAAVESLHGF